MENRNSIINVNEYELHYLSKVKMIWAIYGHYDINRHRLYYICSKIPYTVILEIHDSPKTEKWNDILDDHNNRSFLVIAQNIDISEKYIKKHKNTIVVLEVISHDKKELYNDSCYFLDIYANILTIDSFIVSCFNEEDKNYHSFYLSILSEFFRKLGCRVMPYEYDAKKWGKECVLIYQDMCHLDWEVIYKQLMYLNEKLDIFQNRLNEKILINNELYDSNGRITYYIDLLSPLNYKKRCQVIIFLITQTIYSVNDKMTGEEDSKLAGATYSEAIKKLIDSGYALEGSMYDVMDLKTK